MEAFVSAIGEHKVLMLAGSIAYTTALALAPFVLIILAFASLLGQKFQNQMYAQMTALLGDKRVRPLRLWWRMRITISL